MIAASPEGLEANKSDDSLQSKIAVMAERERRLMELLNASAPERIEHDLRNVLNELVLLRALFKQMDDKPAT